jgi:hypothetical protein
MHLQVSESSQLPGISAISGGTPVPTTTLTSPWLRPRLQGNRQALRDQAFNAKAADWARVQFTVRLATKNSAGAVTGDVFNNFQALLTIEQAPLLGQDPQTTYPADVVDVSGYFAIEGRIAVDLSIYGTCRAVLTLIRRTNPTTTPATSIFTLTQVFAEQWAIDVEQDGDHRGEE